MANRRDYQADVLVIGGGAAGLCAARTAAHAGASVILVTKGEVDGLTNSTIIGRVLTRATAQAEQELIYQVVHAGAFLNDQRLVETFARGVAERMPRLLDLGALIHPQRPERVRRPDGWVVERAQGHTSGYGLTHPLWEAAQEAGTQVVERCAIIDLLKSGPQVVGAVGADLSTGDLITFQARATVLAAGGGSR